MDHAVARYASTNTSADPAGRFAADLPSVLITGTSRGIGRATAHFLSEAGLTVFAGVRNPADGARVEEESEGRIRSVTLDVTDDASIAAARDAIGEAVGAAGLGGLVNNAAAGFGGTLEHTTRRDLEQAFAVNFHGVVLTTSAFLPLLRLAAGRIVNVGGGGAGRLAIPLMGVGCASKFAVEGMTDALRVELRKVGIKVSLVEPGMTYADADKPIFLDTMNSDIDESMSEFQTPRSLTTGQRWSGYVLSTARFWTEPYNPSS